MGNAWSYMWKNNYIRIIILGALLTGIGFLLDNMVARFLSGLHTVFLIAFFSILTMLGNIEVFLALVIIISVVFIAHKKRLEGFWLSIVSSLVINTLLKLIFLRQRPYESLGIASIINTTWSSFPSGHAMIMFCTLPFLIKNFPAQKIYFWTIAVLVALSRIYLNVHYLSDIIAGAFLGYLIGKISLGLEKRISWRKHDRPV